MVVNHDSDTPYATGSSHHEISAAAARLSIAASAATLLFLAGLHILSPEFGPSWRMVSEYANGHYGWVLSLMFISWAVSSWALAYAIRPQITSPAGKVGLALLIVAGIGEAMASVFDIRHDILHNVAGALGILGLPIAAVLVSVSLGRAPGWSAAKRTLLTLANLTWVSVVLMAASLVLMRHQFIRVTGSLPQHVPTVLPKGVIGLDGWADRLIIGVFCVWAMTVAWKALKLRGKILPCEVNRPLVS